MTVVKMGGYVGNNPRIDDYCLGEGNMSEFTNQSKNTPVIIGSVFGEFGGFMPLPFAKHEVSDEVVKHALEERFKENTDESPCQLQYLNTFIGRNRRKLLLDNLHFFSLQ